MELHLEGLLAQVHLMLKERIFQALVYVISRSLEQLPVGAVRLDSRRDGLRVICTSEASDTLRKQGTDSRVQFLPLVLGELGTEGVDGNVNSPPVCLELENLAHELGGRAAQLHAKGVEVLEVGLVQSVTNDLDVDIGKVLKGDALGKIRGKRGVDNDLAVQFLRGRGDAERGHGVEEAERVALVN